MMRGDSDGTRELERNDECSDTSKALLTEDMG